jgi:hypothetical protein
VCRNVVGNAVGVDSDSERGLGFKICVKNSGSSECVTCCHVAASSQEKCTSRARGA